MDLPTPTTCPMTQVGYNTVFAMYKNNEYCQSINLCVDNGAKLISFFSSAGQEQQDANCAFFLELGVVANTYNVHI